MSSHKSAGSVEQTQTRRALNRRSSQWWTTTSKTFPARLAQGAGRPGPSPQPLSQNGTNGAQYSLPGLVLAFPISRPARTPSVTRPDSAAYPRLDLTITHVDTATYLSKPQCSTRYRRRILDTRHKASYTIPLCTATDGNKAPDACRPHICAALQSVPTYCLPCAVPRVVDCATGVI